MAALGFVRVILYIITLKFTGKCEAKVTAYYCG